MNLKVFSTKREIREYIKEAKEGLLPKLLTIEEFINRAIITDYNLLPKEFIPVYLHKAAKNIDIQRLGIDPSFESFLEEFKLIYSFFKELFLEKVDIEELAKTDVYGDFKEHIEILKALYDEYERVLREDGFVDFITLKQFEINKEYFEEFDQIEIYLSGYLSKFDLEIIKNIKNSKIYFDVDRFNKSLVKKMFNQELKNGRYFYSKGEITKIEDKREDKISFEISSFATKVEQANFVFAKIMEFYKAGIKPENIGVILPDEEFKTILEIFDEKNNLNFAMGHSFKNSDLFILLDSIYKALVKKDKVSLKRVQEDILEEFKNIKDFKELEKFILSKANDKEKSLIAQPLFELGFILKDLKIVDMLRVMLKKFEELSFDDVGGGKVSVLGVLESRGVRFEGVIVVDFNEKIVPKVGSEDMFLNTKLREAVNLPTISQKEQLQKHYYYKLFSNAKRVALSYIENEEMDISRFFYELESQNSVKELKEKRDYSQVLYSFSNFRLKDNELIEFEIPKKITPTSLEMLLKCPKRYYLSKKVKTLKEESFGSLVHSAINGGLNAKDENEYFDKIWQHLIRDKSKNELLQIHTKWYKKLKRFAKEDFKLLGTNMATEEQKERKLNNFILQARADRVVYKDNKAYIYDFKTNNTINYLKSYNKDEAKLQGEFYSYIWDSDEVYFWDLYNTTLQKVDVKGAKDKIMEALGKIKGVTYETQDFEYCKYCPFKFGCKGEI